MRHLEPWCQTPDGGVKLRAQVFGQSAYHFSSATPVAGRTEGLWVVERGGRELF